jgi:hypothetical protein
VHPWAHHAELVWLPVEEAAGTVSALCRVRRVDQLGLAALASAARLR